MIALKSLLILSYALSIHCPFHSQLLFNCYANTLIVSSQSLHNSSVNTTIQSPRNRCAIAVQSLRNHWATTVQSPRNHCVIAVQSSRKLSVIAAWSMQKRCAITAHALRNRYVITS
jgi:hypothetical protein